jgi:hypothetical protein
VMGVQERRRHLRATKGKAGGLARSAEGAGQNCRDTQIETPHAPPYRARICTTLLGEASLRSAIGPIDGFLVGLREVRGRMSENPVRAHPLQVRVRAGFAVAFASAWAARAAAVARTPIAIARTRKPARR